MSERPLRHAHRGRDVSVPLTIFFFLSVFLGYRQPGFAADPARWLLLEIGRPDASAAELALGPGDAPSRYQADGYFIVGHSEARLDWPYAHPGAADGWAGNRTHTFTIVFNLKARPAPGTCALRIDLLDAHPTIPGSLQVQINGQTFQQAIPCGGSGESIAGDTRQARPFSFEISFPADTLAAGTNTIRLTNTGPCWLLYDWLGLEGPVAIQVDAPEVKKGRLLWQIGQPDASAADLALGPNRHEQYADDGFFVVGRSDARRDWPYVHPGAADAWAGSRPHAFTILFYLKSAPRSGFCKLRLKLLETHPLAPPELLVTVNGAGFSRALPRGGSDDSLAGNLAGSRPCELDLLVPATELQAGRNEVTITNRHQSWMLYDWVGFEAPGVVKLTRPPATLEIGAPVSPPVLLRQDGGALCQELHIPVTWTGPDAPAILRAGDVELARLDLHGGARELMATWPAVDRETTLTLTVEIPGLTRAERRFTLRPVRQWEVYLLPQTHADYLWLRPAEQVTREMGEYFEQAIDAARQTAALGPDARYKWNAEVLWPVDRYLATAAPEKKEAFLQAVREGTIGLDAYYGGPLTAVGRPEELGRLMSCAHRLNQRYHLGIDSAMLTDVPGFSWGLAAVTAHSGIKYISSAPNEGDPWRLAWADRPFYWVAPGGDGRVLFWMSGQPYTIGAQPVFDLLRTPKGERDFLAYLEHLQGSEQYPYAIAAVRLCSGDQAAPLPQLSQIVRDWNAKYAYPRLIIATNSQMFHAFEERYGHLLPEVRGDLTPYWEQGIASAARETAQSRAAAERLTQAETLWAIRNPRAYPAEAFYQAWNDVVMFSEHSWGAWDSIERPDGWLTRNLWHSKVAFADEADTLSQRLLVGAMRPEAKPAGTKPSKASPDNRSGAVDVYNTASWARSGVVLLPPALSAAGDHVRDAQGRPVVSQRLSTGELAILAENVPPFGASRYRLGPGHPDKKIMNAHQVARAEGATLNNGRLTVRLDERTGAIASLRSADCDCELVDSREGGMLNSYAYILDQDARTASRVDQVQITVKESGPLVASPLVRSAAPGCNSLTREVRLTGGSDRLELINTVDKQKVLRKESAYFEFPFNVPGGELRLDLQWVAARPEADQLAGSAKNLFTVQRWVDVSNQDYGVTWAPVDAPLVEPGPLTAAILMDKLAPTQRLNSLVMSNHWHCNYRAYQEGMATFRYVIQPHRGFDPAGAARLGVEASQPLIAFPASVGPPPAPPVRLEAKGVLATALKPSEDQRAVILRLFGASGRDEDVTLDWASPAPTAVWLSDFTEQPKAPVSGPIHVPGYGIVTLRAERGE